MFCRHCGKELPSSVSQAMEVNFCPQCGKSITEQITVSSGNLISKASRIRRISLILGIIIGIWTAVLLISVIDYNVRLASVRENTFGLGIIVVERVAPSIEISTIIALLFVAITIVLIVRPTRSRLIAVGTLSTVNLILTFWVINQISQILYELFVMISIGIIFNIAVMIFAAAASKRKNDFGSFLIS
jgi:hypothetical protein